MNSIIVSIVRLLVFLGQIYSKIFCSLCRLIGMSYEKGLEHYIAEHKLNEKTPEQLQEWLRLEYNYKEDKIDYAKDYRVFMRDKRGDCDDFAAFMEVLLPMLGYENVYVVTVMADNKRGHAMCIATLRGLRYGFGNWQIRYFLNDDLEHVGEIISQGMSGKLWFALKYVHGKFVSSIAK